MLVVIFARLAESEWRGCKQKHNDYKKFLAAARRDVGFVSVGSGAHKRMKS